jgi:hypothetical protein
MGGSVPRDFTPGYLVCWIFVSCIRARAAIEVPDAWSFHWSRSVPASDRNELIEEPAERAASSNVGSGVGKAPVCEEKRLEIPPDADFTITVFEALPEFPALSVAVTLIVIIPVASSGTLNP